MESGLSTKSSNEILTELFGAFNAEPPEINEQILHESSMNENDSKHGGKKSKKSKSKKSKKKHSKSKSKSRKRKRGDDDNDESDSASGHKKRKRSKEKKSRRKGSPESVNIELPVNKVPMALEIMLDGTVGIKREDGVIMKIPDVCETDKNISEGEETDVRDVETNVNGCDTVSEKEQGSTDVVVQKGKLSDSEAVTVKSDSNVTKLFETDAIDTGEKVKRGKIQIKDLKFSSIFQENVKAAEELKKKDYEEGELIDSSEDEQTFEAEVESKEKSKGKSHSRHKHHSSSRSLHRKSRSDHSRRKRYSRSRSRSRSTSRSRSKADYKSSSGHHSHRHSKRIRSTSRDHGTHHSSDPSRRRSHSSDRFHSRSRTSHRSRSRSRDRSPDRRKSESSHRSKSKEIKPVGKSKDQPEPIEKIDKEKLLAIARKNALKLIDAGVVPGAEKLTAIKAGGKTVNELTEYCKKLSEKEALGDGVSDIDSDSSDDEEKPFHHPFQVRDRPSSIIMNIKNSIPLPVKSLQEKAAEQAKQLRMQFPVSSGSSHRRTESEWVPVSPPKKDEVPPKQTPAVAAPPRPMTMPPPPLPVNHHQSSHMGVGQIPMPLSYMSAVPPPELPNKPVFPVIQPNPPVPKLDISSIVSKRLEAIRKLQENPNDSLALTQMYSAQQEMQYWAESKQETGAFTGSTGAKVLTPSELSSGAQAWVRRDQLTNATPVSGGMGMALLQKMGWQPGEGLGKNKEGTLEPLRLEIKMDKRGLVAPDESRKGRRGGGGGGGGGNAHHHGPSGQTVKTLDGKHPVSLLNELCSRRRYGIPQFELCFECGPDHKKNFLFKVRVNGIEYTPTVASPNKKQAKAEAAAVCLRALGIISNTPR